MSLLSNLAPGVTDRQIDDASGPDMSPGALEAYELLDPYVLDGTVSPDVQEHICELIDNAVQDGRQHHLEVRELIVQADYFSRVIIPIVRGIVATGIVSPDARDTLHIFLADHGHL